MKTLCLGCMKEYEGEFDICPYCGYQQSAGAKEAYHITPGTMLHERYIIGRVLGFGGFGITYIGFDSRLLHAVAIKEYFPSEFATRMPRETMVHVFAGEKQEQFLAGMHKSLEEAKRLAEFRQTPGITQIYDFFEENNTAYIVMELLQGETVKERLKRVNKMSVEEALPIILSVTAALTAVHKKGIIHRDISPDNIYLLDTGEVKLLDFGAARQVTTTHSKSLTVILKLGYAPIEQYQSGGNQGPWTDIYSLAATFYKMITGIRPPESPERRIKDTLKEPSKLGIKIPSHVENALMNALQVRIQDRIQSAEEFEHALTSLDTSRTRTTKEREDMGKWPLWSKLLCLSGGMVLMIAAVLVVSGVIVPSLPKMTLLEKQDDTVWMPSLINLSQNMARNRLEELGLQYALGGTEASDTIMKGYVLRQEDESGNSLQAGEEVKKGTQVNVIISTGNGTTEMPDIIWMDKNMAMNNLSWDGLVDVTVKEDFDTWAKAGTITAVEPEAGTEIPYEQKITIYVAQKNPEIKNGEQTIPLVENLDQEEAKAILEQKGLYLEKIKCEYSSTVPQGKVISQKPIAGEVKEAGSTVEVIVSRGPYTFTVIDVLNQPEEEASDNLMDLGMDVEIEEVYTTAEERGLVVGQSIAAGKIVEEGTTIVLTVSMGESPRVRTALPKTNAKNISDNTSSAQKSSGTTEPRQQEPVKQAEPQPVQVPEPQAEPQPVLDPAFQRLE